MKYFIYPLYFIALIVATACSDHDDLFVDENIPNDQKQEIAFTISDTGRKYSGGTSTRAGFESATDIVARFESFKSSSVGGTPTSEKRSTRTILKAQAQGAGKDYSLADYLTADYRRYWDDAFGRFANISVYAVAVPGQENTLQNNGKQLNELLSYAGEAISTNNTNWKKDGTADADKSNNNISWTVTKGTLVANTSITGQTIGIIANEDLCYSNNIQANSVLGNNGRYVWNFTADTPGYEPELTGAATHSDGQMRLALQNPSDKTKDGHFDKGHLVFRHALTRLTINLKRGTGFESPAPFAFKNEADDQTTNIKIIGVPVAGTLNIETGVWNANPTIGNIEKMAVLTPAAGSDYTHSLLAQFVPGYVFTEGDNSKNVLEYTIDDNTYYITPGIIYRALTKGKDAEGNVIDINSAEIEQISSKNAVQMKQGKNYIINITVNKTAIADVTASLVDWVDIDTQEFDAHNSYITLNSIKDKTDKPCDNFDLYRLNDDVNEPYTSGTEPVNKNWYTHYTDKATLTDLDNGKWKTNWYWESNKSFYHFRTVNKTTAVVEGTGTGADKKDYFAVTSGQLVDDKNTSGFNDYHWGAPMYKDVTMKYDESKGFEDFIYPAIGSTTSTINIIEHHMMSNIHIVLHTPTETDNTNHTIVVAGNGVTLKDGDNTTTVELNRFYKDGTVEMGRGVVNPVTTTGSMTASAGINAPATYFTSRDIEIGGTTYSDVTDVGKTNKYSYRVVPQSLNRGTTPTEADKIGLTITTPDGNKYFVPELAVIIATTVGTNNQHHTVDQPVTRWYPGYDYTYHINLKKTGIESITCSIVDWVKVETGSIDIGL